MVAKTNINVPSVINIKDKKTREAAARMAELGKGRTAAEAFRNVFLESAAIIEATSPINTHRRKTVTA